MKYAKHSENEGQEKGWLTLVHYKGREVWVQWHPDAQEATVVYKICREKKMTRLSMVYFLSSLQLLMKSKNVQYQFKSK